MMQKDEIHFLVCEKKINEKIIFKKRNLYYVSIPISSSTRIFDNDS